LRRFPSKRRNAASGAKSSSATATTVIASPSGGYVGRFAPSPTGPLHLGSLATAIASCLEARARSGRWLIRIEDLDGPRTVPGMADRHLRTLEALGFHWDERVRVQSAHRDAYDAALERLRAMDRTYACSCSRAEIADLQPRSDAADEEELHYPGTCRRGMLHPERPVALRFVVPEGEVSFEDRWQGPIRTVVSDTSGDFIVRRRDGIIAYQLAVVVDDALQGVTDVVRGCDLLVSTARQILLQEALGLPRPQYAHVPLVIAADGQKLAKSRHAIGVEVRDPPAMMVGVLALLHQQPPRELARASITEVWAWAEAHWNPKPLAGLRALRAPE
jgi:glutamyl-Q tRNA(Asp) synthetase